MSSAIDRILNRSEQTSDNQNGSYRRSDFEAPSYKEYKDANYYEDILSVEPRRFDIRPQYPDRDTRPAQNVGQNFGYQGYTQNYAPMDFGYPQAGFMGQGAPTQSVAPSDAWQQTRFLGYAAQQEAARKAEFEMKLSAQNSYAAAPEKTAEHIEAQNKPKMKKRLNAKAAIILSLYLAVVAVVITLIGVNAGKINSGKAVVPAGQVTTQIEQEL